MHGSDDFGLRICTGRAEPDNPVRCDAVTYIYLNASANIDIATGPLTTDV
jgi:hypothetical protein